ARIEAETRGRLGVVILNTGSGKTMSYRADERFPMCSTFKVLAVAAVLARVDSDHEQLDRHIVYSSADLLDYAPITKQHVREGFMTLEALCEAAIRYSDNTAANLILNTVGGPSGVTNFARTLGDGITVLNRTEPSLNTAVPGDPRDTTTPIAMAHDLRQIVMGGTLTKSSRERLIKWLVACETGGNCLRAGIPHSWTVGDKTGSGGSTNTFGDSDTRNDIAIGWPPGRAPLVITVYLTESKLPADRRDAAIAAVGRIATAFA
ncbi:MAG: class A beta-lactamase, partial [Candidatus Eremiobacteraeota bacterium]|nr:class A beta-lactamase [Candidatus Eremiobacteraeota bacterium]